MKKFIISAIVLGSMSSYSIVFANWSAPTSTPPNGNTERPLDVSSLLQTKAGALVAQILAATVEMRSDRYCDATGNNCYQPLVGGGSGISNLTAGSGITFTPTTLTGTGTISANLAVLQQRVTGACPVGQAIRSVNSDGSVICQAMAVGSASCLHKGITYATNYQCRSISYPCTFSGQSLVYMRCGSDGTWSYPVDNCRTGPAPTGVPFCPN